MNDRNEMAKTTAFGILTGLTCGLAHADIVARGGNIEIVDPPADIRVGQWESDLNARIWRECDATLATPLAVDAVNNVVVWLDGQGNTPGTIPAMTEVTSYMLRADSIGTRNSRFDGFVRFDQPVLGLIFLNPNLDSSDGSLSKPGVLYNRNQSRGLEALDGDIITLSGDRRQVDFHLFPGGWTDDVRIITAVPGPGTFALGGFALPLLVARRRR